MGGKCYHCGQDCGKDAVEFDNKPFCCNGCKTVYEILNQHNLSDYYELNKMPGIQPDTKTSHHFDYLDTPDVFDKIIDFNDGGIAVVTFHVPVIHCSSCVWVLESLQDLNLHITQSMVNFARRTVQITYKSDELKLSELAIFMTELGYKPSINLKSTEKTQNKIDRKLLFQLVVAGFCFGNIMLLAFPEYANPDEQWLKDNRYFFRWLMFALAIPVLVYSAQDYLRSAYLAIKNKLINIDIPIAIGILALFFRSAYEVMADVGSGYFDSFAGLLFFMLIGKWFQRQTYQSMAFDRDYKSFYPIAITKIVADSTQTILLSDLKKGDRILLRDEEILPADAILMKGEAQIDNSFVTGEYRLIPKKIGDRIFAGGKQMGTAIELEIINNVNQSYLTQLWNNEAFSKETSHFDTVIDRVSKYFVWIVLAIAAIAAIYWAAIDISKMFQVITAILIVACPCALALSVPFTLGNVMRIFGKNKMYVKDVHTVENMAKIDTVVFDKTGTITESNTAEVVYSGTELNDEEKGYLKSVLNQSNHPLSRILHQELNAFSTYEVTDYEQVKGKGQEAEVEKHKVRLGSKKWVAGESNDNPLQSEVWVKIDDDLKGVFLFKNHYRKGFSKMIQQLGNYRFAILSGDNASEKETLGKMFPPKTELLFNQSPQDKLSFIQKLQVDKNRKVMMLGDGLNDAGALKQSNVGIVVAEDMNSFSPSCDAILSSRSFVLIPKFLQLSRIGIRFVKIAFVISFMYNIIGLSFAVTGNLKPVVAAILMPVSSISVVLFATLSTWLGGYFIFRKKK